ncbi:hypothetical protein SEA_TOOJ_41 [Mycobacterium phage Tooj]|nr:hypothetical protein SEA_TOOJ_41 [Mycobacterium phage Tooj]
MAVTAVLFETSGTRGNRLDPDVRDEIEALAPGLETGEVTTDKIANNAVTREKIDAGAVGSVELDDDAVKAQHIDDGAVGTPALAAGSVTSEKTGIGVVTAEDASGNPVEVKQVYMSVAQYNALATKDPNTDYYLS